MLKERTLTELRRMLQGRIYIHLGNETIGKKFLQDAESEGYRFGQIKPTETAWDDIVALGNEKQLSSTGFYGHMAFRCSGGSSSEGIFHRIDYQKFVNGDIDYFYRSSNHLYTVQFESHLFGNVTIHGEKCSAAMNYIDKYLSLCKTKKQENALYNTVTNKFDVVVTN